MKSLSIFTLLTLTTLCYGQDSLVIYFLHGSKPKKSFKRTQDKWFGGKLGGHTGIALNNSKILHFLPTNGTNIFPSEPFKSKFVLSLENDFWNILGSIDSVESTIIKIPISNNQKDDFNKLKNNYLREIPYDYAFFGYRCGSSSYDLLSQLRIVKSLKSRETIYKIFYPKKLRKRLLKLKNISVYKSRGSSKRNWER